MKNRKIFLLVALLLTILPVLANPIEIDTSANISRCSSNDIFATWSPDGNKIVYQSDRNGNWDIFVYDMLADTTIQITYSAEDEQHPVWHPIEKAIIFDAGTDQNLYLYKFELSTGQTIPLFDRQVICKQPSITGDGRMVYFLGFNNQHGNWELFSYHFIYDNLNQLTRMKQDGTYLGLSPDGKLILYGYNSDFYPYHHLKIFNWYGMATVKMNEHNILYAAWHPDGLKMYYISNKENPEGELYSIWKDGTHELRLTDDHFQINDFSISPDGNFLACSVFVNGNCEIIIIPINSF